MMHSHDTLRLSDRFTAVACADLAEARPAIERLQGSFLARPGSERAQRQQPVHVRAAHCGEVAVSTFKFGRTVDIVPHGLAGAILVTTAISGRAGLQSRQGDHGIGAGATFISHEEDAPTFSYDVDTEVLKLRFDRQRFESFALTLDRAASRRPLCFHNVMAAPGAAARWGTLLSYVVATLNAGAQYGASASALELARLEELLMLTLLNLQPGSHQAQQAEAVAKVSPRQFRLGVDYIHEHLEDDIRLGDIAAAAACSIRSLTRAFHLASDTTPMQYVHALRLQRVRGELGPAHGAARERTIADIAYHWGFRHLGEFNRKYRETFGETPSDTRQRNSQAG